MENHQRLNYYIGLENSLEILVNKVQRWIVKDSKGRLQGPYTTQQILQKISFGEIGGEEYISPYPGTNWVPISQEPDFFDHLLKVLANLNDDQIEVVHEEENFDGPLDSDHAHPPSDDRNEKKESLEDKTVNIGTDKSGHSETVKINVTQEKKEKAHGPTSDHVIREPKTGNRERVKEEKTKRAKKYKKKSSDDDVIELEDQKELDKKEKLKQAKIPLISLVVIVVIIGVWLFLPNSNSRATKLIFPKKKRRRHPFTCCSMH